MSDIAARQAPPGAMPPAPGPAQFRPGGHGYDYGYGYGYGYSQEADPGSALDLSLARILEMVRRRVGLFLLLLFTITAIGIVLALLIPDRYRSQASILVLSEPSNIVDIESVVTGVSNDQVGILSEIELIKSIEVVNRVVNDIGEEGQLGLLGSDLTARSLESRIGQLYDKTVGLFDFDLDGPSASASLDSDVQVASVNPTGDWTTRVELSPEVLEELSDKNIPESTARLLRRNLAVSQVGRSRVIEIDFTFVDSVIAADIANRFADSYIAAQVQAKFDATQKANLLLNEQLTTLRSQIANLESQIETYRSENGLINRDAAVVAGQRVEQLSQELIRAKAQLASIQARKSEAESIRQGDRSVGLENTAEVLGSELIGNLRLREIEIEQELTVQERQLADNHPTLVNLRDELGQLRSRIASEIGKIVQSIESDENALRAEIEVLQENLSDADVDVAQLNRAERELDALNMEVEANRNLLEVFLARAKETDVQEEFQQPDAQVISAANIRNSPSSPNRQIYFLLSLLAGIGCALGAVVYLELSDPTVHTLASVRELTRMPIYGMLPRIASGTGKSRAAALSQMVRRDPSSSLAEALRRVYVKIGSNKSEKDQRAPGKLIMFTSSRPSEGKTSLACSLAIAVRRFDKKVIVIDGDLRRPRVHRHFKTGREKGIVDFLEGHCEIQEIVSRDNDCGVDLIIRGSSTNRPSELVSAPRLPGLLEALRRHYDFIILDTAPILAAVETKQMMSLADELVYLLRWGSTTRDEFEAALRELPAPGTPGAPNAGLVINDVDPASMRALRGLSASYYSYYDYYKKRA